MYYWATFRRRGQHRVRLDTRVYLLPRSTAPSGGHCIGCVIGKNPGSAIPGGGRRGCVAMELNGDRFLPNVRAVVSKAYARTGMDLPPDAYVQVLNLFYLCDRNLSQALAKLRGGGPLPRCPSEGNEFPWAWYVWGGNDKRLNAMKMRFQGLKARRCFFFDGASQQIVNRAPEPEEMARHTQGLGHDPLVAHLAAIVANGPEAR